MKKRFMLLAFVLLLFPQGAQCAAKIKDASFSPKQHAISFSFSAPGLDYVQITYRSSRESGTVLITGENGVFAGEIALPLTYAGNNVSVKILSLVGKTLNETITRTEYPQPTNPITPAAGGSLFGITVCIDPGHQLNYQGGIEPIGPGLKGNKTVVYGMAEGIVTKRKEATVVLEISLQLRDELIKRGAQVVMTRDIMDKTVSNLDRAAIANDAGADICLRLHGNATKDSTKRGITIYGPLHSDYAKSLADPKTYLSWGQALFESMQNATGTDRGGANLSDKYVGSNWCKMPVFLVEMGFMTNPREDLLLSDPVYQQKLCLGMADGIEAIMIMRGIME